jgi:monoterpene epsilon-lactone hydrolase
VTKIRFSGPAWLRVSSFIDLNRIGMATFARHALGRRLEPTWDAAFETGVRFWRRQFEKAMGQSDMAQGRRLFDSLQTETDDVYDVTEELCGQPQGTWYVPRSTQSGATLLYFHGGGYTFHGAVSKRVAAMLAHHCGARLFAPDYRLTPEHPHPAQAEDALAAWRHVASATPPKRIVIVGDSAGGHMALTLLRNLQENGLPQPALCIGLCPWTDVGQRGASLSGNDPYDLVQGWMALRFGEWLDPEGQYGREALSPIAHDYNGLAPLYLQAGGREVLCDMIADFAEVQSAFGADVMFDLWPDMPHVFQAFDTLKRSSTEALARISAAVRWHVDAGGGFQPGPNTHLANGDSWSAER